MSDLKDFVTPPDHVNFLAKKLFGKCGEIQDGAIAYLEPGGGGPTVPHTHLHHHLFVVVSGKVEIILDGRKVLVRENESFFVKGEIPHSVWNRTGQTVVMLGITVK